jgi:hypothetical protein
MAGAAITIGLQQLKGLLNITAFTTKMDFISVMKSVFQETHERGEWKGLLGLPYHYQANRHEETQPKLFWIHAIAPLVSVIVACNAVRVHLPSRQARRQSGQFTMRLTRRRVFVWGLGFRGFLNPCLGSTFQLERRLAWWPPSLIALKEGVAIGRAHSLQFEITTLTATRR